MANTTPAPETLSAIGRPIDPAWMAHFAECVRSVLPKDVELRLRIRPGIAYVNGGDIKSAGLPIMLGQDDQSQRAIYLQELLGPFYENGELHEETTSSTLNLSLHRPMGVVLQLRNDELKIKTNVEDTPVVSSSGKEAPDDYIIEAEKDTLVEAFAGDSLNRTASSRTEPRHAVWLGILTGYPGKNLPSSIEGELREPVPFSGIDVLDLRLE